MIIHNKMPGGNIFVDKQEGSHVYLKNELRDTTEDWFYWAFCVEGAQGQEITFWPVYKVLIDFSSISAFILIK